MQVHAFAFTQHHHAFHGCDDTTDLTVTVHSFAYFSSCGWTGRSSTARVAIESREAGIVVRTGA
jgi:hypothetical protein